MININYHAISLLFILIILIISKKLLKIEIKNFIMWIARNCFKNLIKLNLQNKLLTIFF